MSATEVELHQTAERSGLSSKIVAPISNRPRSYSASRILDFEKTRPELFKGSDFEKVTRIERNIELYGYDEQTISSPGRRRERTQQHYDNGPVRFAYSERERSGSNKRSLSHSRSASRSRMFPTIHHLDEITTADEQERSEVRDIETYRGRQRNRAGLPNPEPHLRRGSPYSIDMLWSIVDADRMSNELARSSSSWSSYLGSISTSQSFQAESVSTLSRTPSVASSKSSNEDTVERAEAIGRIFRADSPTRPPSLRRTQLSASPTPKLIPRQQEHSSFLTETELELVSKQSFKMELGPSYGRSCQRCLAFTVKCDRKQPTCSACESSVTNPECCYIVKQNTKSDEPHNFMKQKGTVARSTQLQPNAAQESERVPLNLEVYTGSTVSEDTRIPSWTSFLRESSHILKMAYALGKRMSRPALRNGFERIEWQCVSLEYFFSIGLLVLDNFTNTSLGFSTWC
jgi:hypothetical protein